MRTQLKNKQAKLLKGVISILVIFFSTSILNSQPSEDWANRYNGYDYNDKPRTMVMDSEGSLCITGSSEGKDGSKDILTVKYSSEGKEIWTARYAGDANQDGSDDEANAITVDNNGNFYVTGYTHGGVRGRDYCTIKYDPDGNEEWIRFYAGEGRIEDSDEEAVALTTDNNDNLIVTGYSNGRGGEYEYCTIKYNSKGEFVWQKTTDYITGKPTAVKTDIDGNIVISGYRTEVRTGKDFCTVKYNSAGDQLWMQTYNGSGRNVVYNDDEVSSLIISPKGMIYVTGYSYGIGTGKDFVTIKYSVDGYEDWVSRVNYLSDVNIESSDDEPKAAGFDLRGNYFITGKTLSSANGGSDIMTVKLNSSGELQWIKTFDSPQFMNTEDAAEALAVDPSGNVIVTGYSGPVFFSSCGRGRFFCTIKYSSDGTEKWVKEYNGPLNFEMSDNSAKAVLTDSQGRIYVMGESKSENADLDYCLVRYSELKKVITRNDLTSSNEENKYSLNENFPNPFNPSTKISFSIPATSNVKLGIYDVSGREVAILVNNVLKNGNYQYEWNAAQFASGTYFYRIQADGFNQTKKMLLIK
ncbi:MAG TPA: SBBP repeat-containing protein [Ignavibacteria bacterium]|nr:SBBP repeat-containing protein [Ignavibacteria bacterium]